MKDEWYEKSTIILGIILFSAFYYIFKDDVEHNKFFKLGYDDNLVFLHKRINTLYLYLEILAACFIIGFINSYWDNVFHHIRGKKYHLEVKKMSLTTFIVLTKFLNRIFEMLMIYLTVSSNIQFILAYLAGNIMFQIPFTKYYVHD